MTQIDIAKYKPIPNYSRYLISEDGEVWDTVQRKILIPNINGGYKCLNLHRDDGRKLLDKVHRLVAYTYLTKPENTSNHVVHIDTNRMNNHYTNLRWKVKGEVDDSALTYSTLGGVRYSIRQLDDYAKATGLPMWTIRNRLEDKWTLEEMLQGYKHSSVFWIDGMKFIGELEVKKYLDMLDRDSYRKDRELLKCEIRHRRFTEELERLQRERELREKIEKRGTEDSSTFASAKDLLSGIKDRCYSTIESPRYKPNYNGRGVKVCSEWYKDEDVFINWYNRNYIPSWEIDKDIIPLYQGKDNLEYSEESCCFVPKWMNQWFAKVGNISIVKNSKSYVFDSRLTTASRGSKRRILRGDSEEEVFEQYLLTKDLQFEKRVWETIQEYDVLCKRNPKTPKIHPTLISIISNYSTEEYLRLKNIRT